LPQLPDTPAVVWVVGLSSEEASGVPLAVRRCACWTTEVLEYCGGVPGAGSWFGLHFVARPFLPFPVAAARARMPASQRSWASH